MKTPDNCYLEETATYSTTFSQVTCNIFFPEENPKGAIENVTDALAHLGAFNGLTKEEITSN